LAPAFTGIGLISGSPLARVRATRCLSFYSRAAGTFNGSAAVNFSTEAINGSGLGTLGIGSQTVEFFRHGESIAQLRFSFQRFQLTITGAKFRLLDFGSLPSGGGALLATLNLLNQRLRSRRSLLGSFNASGFARRPFS